MSESDRQTIAESQARLVQSLRENGRPLDGFDAKRLELTAAVLARKRERARALHRQELRTMLARAWLRFLAAIRRGQTKSPGGS